VAEVTVTFNVPIPQPSVLKCQLTSANIDVSTGSCSGTCVMVDATGQVQGSENFQIVLTLQQLVDLAAPLVQELVNQGVIPPGTVNVGP
jgi:hypothetical protein